MTEWFSKEWYKYLFSKKSHYYTWFTVLICRIKGHPDGAVWFNPNGVEPDMTCRRCGDNLS